MSDTQDPVYPTPPPERPTLSVIPIPPPAPRPRTSTFVVLLRLVFWFAFFISLGVNVLLLLLLIPQYGDAGIGQLHERYYMGNKESKNKIAVIRVDGIIMEGSLSFVHKQIEDVVKDDRVKAVVLRVNSPGGSISASDDLHKRLADLRDGTTPSHKRDSKTPIIVSMGALAASGGYYISMPADYIVAERTTITGSIGVYAAFPNVSVLANKYGFGMEVIKKGDVKDSGSMFKEMTPQERQLWQDMVDNAYRQFLDVVATGRPQLAGKLERPFVIDRTIQVKDKEKSRDVQFTRYLADGGIYTANQAKDFKLIDQVGYLEDAVKEAAKRAGLGEDYRAVEYDKPPVLFYGLLGSQKTPAEAHLDVSRLSQAASPRLWYLAPQNELAGFLAAMGKEY